MDMAADAPECRRCGTKALASPIERVPGGFKLIDQLSHSRHMFGFAPTLWLKLKHSPDNFMRKIAK